MSALEAAAKRPRFSLAQLLMLVCLAAIILCFVQTLRTKSEPTARWVTSLAFSPDGSQIATNTFRWRRIQVWTPDPKIRQTEIEQVAEVIELATGDRRELRRGRTDRSNWVGISDRVAGQGIQFSPDGRMIGVAVWQEQVELYDATSGALLRKLPARNDGHGDTTIAFADDGSFCATGGWGTIRVFDLSAVRLRAMISIFDRLSSMATMPGGKALVTADDSGRVWLRDITTGGKLLAFRDEPTWGAMAVAVSPDGTIVAAGMYNAAPGVQFWRAADGAKLRFVETEDEPRGISFAPDGRSLAAVDLAGLTLIDVATGTQKKFDRSDGAASVAYSPDGKQVATGSVWGKVTIWNAATGEIIEEFSVGGPYPFLALHWTIPTLALVIWVIVWLRMRSRSSNKPKPKTRKHFRLRRGA